MPGKLPIDKIMEVVGAGREADKGYNEPIAVAVWVDPGAPQALLQTLRDCLLPEQPTGLVEVHDLHDRFLEREDPTDVAVVVPGSCGDAAREVVRSFAHNGTPVAVVVESAVEAPDFGLEQDSASLVGVVAASDDSHMKSKLADWLVGATPKGIAFAANFPFCRDAEVTALVRRCAVSNAAVGAVDLVHGADMPVMTANQAKLALDVAAAYGHGMELARLPEIAGVVVAGVAYRWAARGLCEVVPGLGALVRSAAGYLGTTATGRAVQLRFDLADGNGSERVAQARGAVSALVGGLADVAMRGSEAVASMPLALPGAARQGERAQGDRGTSGNDDYVTIVPRVAGEL